MADDQTFRHVEPIQKERSRCRKWFDGLCKLFIIIFKRRHGGDPCIYIPERIINRPDPCIYSQFLLMQLDQPVTWDNPDVKIFKDGVEQYTYDLTADTEYDLEITVHNSSREKPALGTQVEVRWIEFGAGAQTRHPIATIMADVPVWPGVTKVATKWRTPAAPGHYCIEIELAHPDDGNPSNNRGWNNTQVKAAASEVEIPIRIFNRWVAGPPRAAGPFRNRTWWPILVQWSGTALLAGLIAAFFTADFLPWWRWVYWPVVGYLTGAFAAYAVLGHPTRHRTQPAEEEQSQDRHHLVELTVDSYRFEDKKGKEADPDVIFAPRPPAWPARIEPHIFRFAEDEIYRDVLLIVDAPDRASGPEVFNVNARQDGEPTGGVTVTVTTGEGS